MSFTTALLAVAASVAVLLVLIVRWKVHPFVAMAGVAVVLGLACGIPLVSGTTGGKTTDGLVAVLLTAMGKSVPHVLVLVGFGCIIGEIISRSGGGELLGRKLVEITGGRRAVLAVCLAGLLVGSTIFFDTAVILLAPVVIAVARQVHRNAAVLAVPMAVAVLAVHSVIPPHPGAVAVASALGADDGLLIAFGLATMLPGAALGCWCAYRTASRLEARGLLISPDDEDDPESSGAAAPRPGGSGGSGGSGATTALRPAPSLTTTDRPPATRQVPHLLGRLVVVLVLPVVLILVATLASVLWDSSALGVLHVLQFLGTAEVALPLTTVVAWLVLTPREQRRVTGMSEVGRVGLRPVGEIVLSTGGGIALGGVIAAAGVGPALVHGLQSAGLPLVAFGFLLSVLLRASLGTTTAAVTTVATLLAGSVDVSSMGAAHVALLAVGVCAGGVCLSHVNDAGFWVLSRYFTISEMTMLRTWTVGVTIMGVVCMALTTVLWFTVPMTA
ncbi:GntP family permease [Quadrisphaera oryzae]|uniref:GntP family permease n=1 Tax=Quadrisphaera TaxID=317661 RepID=UPI0016444191|nr:SLC13 family permease [Quadrisphaera sp. RL12-1S]MBC3760784.1 hypothetical protein [Quadrisphaera sp. RL12-1S]